MLASEKRGNFGSRSGGAIIARKGSGITTLSQIRGKCFAFGPMLAPTGYLLPCKTTAIETRNMERELAAQARLALLDKLFSPVTAAIGGAAAGSF